MLSSGVGSGLLDNCYVMQVDYVVAHRSDSVLGAMPGAENTDENQSKAISNSGDVLSLHL